MITIPALLFLAQAAVLQPSTLQVTSPSPNSTHTDHLTNRHSRVLPKPTPVPEVRITIVNAMSKPAITLREIDEHYQRTYPSFPQGEWTANEALSTSVVQYLVQSTNGVLLSNRTIRFQPISSQFLLLTGDLSTKGPGDKLTSIVSPPSALKPQLWPPNIQFHLFPYTLVSKDPFHYRIFNGMPGKPLLLRSVPVGNKAAQQLALLAPGGSVQLVRQPASIDYDAEIDGQVYRLEIRQEGAGANCLIPFFLRNAKPDFIRVFETP